MKFEKVLDKLKKDEKVLAIGMEGSFALGYQDRYSDVDLLLVIKNNSSVKEILELIEKENLEMHPEQELFTNLKMIVFRCDRQVDLKVIKQNEIPEYSFKKMSIFYDPKKILELKKFEPNPENYKFIVYPLRIKKQYEIAKRRKNDLFVYDLIHKSIESILRVLYEINKTEYDCLKWTFKDLKKFKIKPTRFEDKILDIINSKNSQKNIEKINSLGKEVFLLIPDKNQREKIKKHVEWLDGKELKW